jgi:hypothetical protein
VTRYDVLQCGTLDLLIVPCQQLKNDPPSYYLAYLDSPEVSPRAMSENIAFDFVGSHKTADPADVEAPVLDTGTVSVSPSPPEIRFIA